METTVTFNQLKSDLKRLKVVLIILTIMQTIYIGIAFWDGRLWMRLDLDYKANYIVGFSHLLLLLSGLIGKKCLLIESKKEIIHI